MQQLKDRVVLVTGAGSGLGAATSRYLGESGAVVLAADIDSAAAEKVATSIVEAGGRAVGRFLDVTEPESAAQVVKEAVSELGRLDALVNNAGVDATVPVEEMEIGVWDRILDVNLRGPFLMSRAAFPVMRQAGGGHIVNICSTASKRAWANAAGYHASKWGLLGLSHALHVEGRSCNVAVTAVIAGGMRTPFLLDRFPDIDLNVLQDPGSVAQTIGFVLCQPEGSVIPEVTVLPRLETSWP
ncbi:MAG TPA: SDR family oxidoreductase [Actinomycetota bacterium]|nr:SDR family oxidoreductase [Actinomycetota bacterium]